MAKPTPQEFEIAINEAIRLRESGEDQHFLGKSLLNHNFRLQLLEDVLSKAKQYLHSGHGSREHAVLIKAIEKAEQADRFPGETKGML